MDWAVFWIFIGGVFALAFVLACLSQAFSITANYGLVVRAAYFLIAVIFVATVVGFAAHYAQQQDKERQCQQYGGLSCNG